MSDAASLKLDSSSHTNGVWQVSSLKPLLLDQHLCTACREDAGKKLETNSNPDGKYEI